MGSDDETVRDAELAASATVQRTRGEMQTKLDGAKASAASAQQHATMIERVAAEQTKSADALAAERKKTASALTLEQATAAEVLSELQSHNAKLLGDEQVKTTQVLTTEQVKTAEVLAAVHARAALADAKTQQQSEIAEAQLSTAVSQLSWQGKAALSTEKATRAAASAEGHLAVLKAQHRAELKNLTSQCHLEELPVKIALLKLEAQEPLAEASVVFW
eukprot:CAMPEP_0204341140 /NCGR_PEP_ID=MMETSP0469-20131031/23116_1 /ASSEMBLY_ACC=CAM_ASM_000384 /TAXON_ID=2969 /ORGANISM="Oxyrrhis marina" /LENGTH=218 /DNA_ID=CAMNT_0051325807 /DNA_START=13 /DNA_END=666 /DNA_ORIENTATION=+